MMISINNPKGCGIGQGERCCAYLVMGSGFECAREDPLSEVLETKVYAGQMTARRLPTAPIPECQTEGP